ncbi:MAG: SLC13 family permease [Hyphomicrobiaceae bacterium]
MPEPRFVILALIALAIAGFVWGKVRYDVVAGLALLVSVYVGIVPAEDAFAGFGHPAVITVAAVLVISQGLQNGGLVGFIVKVLAPTRRHTSLQVASGSGLTMLLSAVMNNVGALALMLPVTLRSAARAHRPASIFLIPLSFASMLGGLITLIGTPPNLIVSSFRNEYVGLSFHLFDFTAVGLVVALVGLAYLSLVGWRLLPTHADSELGTPLKSTLAPFLAEVLVPAKSPFDGRRVRDIEELCDNEITIMTIVRESGDRFLAPRGITRLRAGDELIIEGDPSVWEQLCDNVRLAPLGRQHAASISLRSEDVVLVNAVVMPHSEIAGQSVRGMRMHDNYGINLLALSRQREPPRSRLKNVAFEVGDLLLLQGERKNLARVLDSLGCLMLSHRRPATTSGARQFWFSILVFVAALVAIAFGLVSAPIALVTAASAFILLGMLSLQEAYNSVEWPIIVLLGALIPIGQAMKSTGAAEMIAGILVDGAGTLPIWAIIAIVMAISMWLSDVIHNTPTAVLMAPIGASIAEALEVSVDPFLMAIAVGSASAYLTPIGHQSNTLVMGPGGYRFSDYTRVGIGLEILVLVVGVPMILLVWPPLATAYGP